MPRRVEEVVVLVPNKYYDRVVTRLASEGIFHVEQPPREVAGGSDRTYLQVFASASEQVSRVESYFKALGSEPTLEPGLKLEIDEWIASYKKTLEAHSDVLRMFERGVARISEAESRINELTAIKSVLEPMRHIDADVRKATRASRLSFAIGIIEGETDTGYLESLAEKANVLMAIETPVEGFTIIAVAGRPGDVSRVVERLRRIGWIPLAIPEELSGVPSVAYEDVTSRIKQLMAEIDRIREELASRLNELRVAYTLLYTFREVFRFLVNTGRTRTLSVFRGFIDTADVKRLKEILDEEARGAYSILSLGVRRAEERVPTKIRMPRILRVFHKVVEIYGEPDPDEVVPTLFMAVTLPIIFALMFPDAGHGLLVVLFALYYMMPRDRDWGILVAILGASSIVSGILAGEFFGPLVSEKIGLYDLWHKLGFETPPLAQPTFAAEVATGAEKSALATLLLYESISIALWIGGFMLSFGSLLGVIDAYLKGETISIYTLKLPKLLFFASVTSPFLVKYDISEAGAVIQKAIFEMGGGDPLATFTIYGAIIGLAWMFIGGIVEAVIEGHNPLSGLGHGFLEAYESLLMAMGNIPSFLRIMALALAHSSLMLGFTDLYHVIAGGGFSIVFGVIVYIIGNLLAAGLEGILAFAHSVRLHFYEWFSKFYSGTGIPFKPVSIPNVQILLR
ncbi:MAG: V-type ATP synthase subunit I [Desulfurococcales archaeon]|nr:V-type ATP synthase subunit I [Desulfurococcales archaeon]